MSVGGEDFSPKTLAALNTIRETTKRRYRILSAYRSPNHNTKAGGVEGSQHIKGIAIDLWVPHSNRNELYTAAKAAGFSGFGWGNSSVILIKERSVGGRMMTMEMLCLEIKNDNISIRLQII